mmetsp:Transcript_70869/g.125178  ORF Transcript_70869/g.125178 Transcript_70869/m.125178 type:complete len:694 (+) Transcript_70869:72-2153(+)
MKRVQLLLSTAAALARGADISYQMDYSAATSPVQKVVELLTNMVTQGEKEMQDEKLQFATYSQWCKMTKEQKAASIETAEQDVESIDADIKKAAADIEMLGAEMAKHQTAMDSLTKEQESLIEVRKERTVDFVASQKDYAASIDSISRAVATLKKQAYDRKQAEEKAEADDENSLLEMSTLKNLAAEAPPRHAREVQAVVAAFLQQKKGDSKQPAVAGYEFQSQGVVQMLSDMQDKFQAEKVNLEKTEADKQAAYDSALLGLKNQEAAEKDDHKKKSGFKLKKETAKAQLESELQETRELKSSDQEYLDEITTTCDQKATDFESRSKLRSEELEAIHEAIGIIGSGDVKGNEQKHLAKSFVQVKSSARTALARLRASRSHSPIAEKIAGFLQSEGQRLHSQTLLNLATPVVNSKALVSIKDLLTKLVEKLQDQALDEQKHKDYCNKELATNQMTRKEKTEHVEELNADMDRLHASVTKLSAEVAQGIEDVAELVAAVSNATEIRSTEKSKNSQTIADAQAAQAAVSQATTVLKDFYEKAGQATALVQKTSAGQPAIFDDAYKGMGGESGGVMAILETISSDFAKLEAETDAEEKSSADDYEKFMKEAKLNKKEMEIDVANKKEASTEQNKDYEDKKVELETEEKALNASLLVFETLKEQCLNAEHSYEEEQRQRAETIESLQNALEMLNNAGP